MGWEVTQNLFIKYQNGDSAVIDELFIGLNKYVLSSLLSNGIDKPIAEELSQIILLKIHVNRDRYDQNRPLKAWVVTILKRSLIDHWRRDKSGLHHKDPEILDDLPEEGLTTQKKMEAVDYLNLLHPNDKTIVYRHIWLGEKLGEIAESQGLTLAAVKSRFRRSLKRLAKHE